MERTVKLVVEAVVDVAAIIGLVFLAHAGKLDGMAAAGIIAVLAGGNLGTRVVQARSGAAGTSLPPPPAAPLVLVVGALATWALNTARVLAVLLTLGGIGALLGAP